MTTYVPRFVSIEAVQFDGENAAEVAEFCGWDEVPKVERRGDLAYIDPIKYGNISVWSDDSQYAGLIYEGDYIIKLERGEDHPEGTVGYLFWEYGPTFDDNYVEGDGS